METLLILTGFTALIFIFVILFNPIIIHRDLFIWPNWDGDGVSISKATLYKVRLIGFYYVSHDYDHHKRHPKNHVLYEDFLESVKRLKK